MKLITENGYKYIDQELKEEISKIWSSYNVAIPDNKKLFFAKNCKNSRMIHDYNVTDISRTIKLELADYVVLRKLDIRSYPIEFPHYKDEVFYSIGNLDKKDYETVVMLTNVIRNYPNIKFVNEIDLNRSVHNGFVIDKNNYNGLLELLNSSDESTNQLGYEMICNSSFEKNWEWILYCLYESGTLRQYYRHPIGHISDKIFEYFKTSKDLTVINMKLDNIINIIKNDDILEIITIDVRNKFKNAIHTKIYDLVGSDEFVLDDFVLNLKSKEEKVEEEGAEVSKEDKVIEHGLPF